MVVQFRVWLTACAFSSLALAPAGGAFAAGSDAVSQPAPQLQVSKDELDSRALVLSLSCASCHGTDGKSLGIIPSISSLSTAYIETSLVAFKSGTRSSTVMSRHAKGYTDEEIRLIAEYFGNVSRNNK